MLDIILAGGWLMTPILLCSVLSLAIIFERFWTLQRKKVLPASVGPQVQEWASQHALDKNKIEQCHYHYKKDKELN